MTIDKTTKAELSIKFKIQNNTVVLTNDVVNEMIDALHEQCDREDESLFSLLLLFKDLLHASRKGLHSSYKLH